MQQVQNSISVEKWFSVYEIPGLGYGSKCVNAVIHCYTVLGLNKLSSLLIHDKWKIEANEW
jgi:hypothetical protein